MSFFSGITDALSGGVGSAIAGIGGGLLSYFGQQSANQTNQADANAQMAFQASQTGTQYQRAVADMKAAGINPMLASQVGGNAAASGSMATVQNAMLPAVNSAQSAATTTAQLDNIRAQTNQANAAADNQAAQANLNSLTAGKVVQDTLQSSANTANLSATLPLIQQNVARALADTNLTNAQIGKVQNEIGLIMNQADYTISRTAGQELANKMIQFQLPAARASSNAASSWYGQHVAPYVPYVNDLLSPLNSAASIYSKVSP